MTFQERNNLKQIDKLIYSTFNSFCFRKEISIKQLAAVNELNSAKLKKKHPKRTKEINSLEQISMLLQNKMKT